MHNFTALLRATSAEIDKNKKLQHYYHIHEYRYLYILKKITQLSLSPKDSILDIGCYPLHLFVTLQKMGYDLFGLSSHHESIQEKNITITNIEKEKIPFANDTFCLVIMTEVIEHLTVSPTIYLKEIYRVLRPGGYLLITTPNVAHAKNRLKMFMGKNIYFPLFQLYETNNHEDGSIYHRHNREYTQRELIEIMRCANFTIRDARFFSAYPPFRKTKSDEHFIPRMVKLFGYFLTQLIPQTRDSLYLLAQKK